MGEEFVIKNSYFISGGISLLGLLMFLLRKNQNKFFGYRTKRSNQSKHHFELANKEAGLACFIYFALHLFLSIAVEVYTKYSLIGWPNAILVYGFFIVLIIVIEVRLARYKIDNNPTD